MKTPPGTLGNSRRRRVLQALATAGISGLVGCSEGSSDDSSNRSANATTNRSFSRNRPRITQEPVETETDDSSLTPSHPGTDVEPSDGVVTADDPDWRMLGHDTGNSFHNPHADGPSADPSVRWTLERNMSAFSPFQAYHPLIVDGIVYTTLGPENEDGPYRFVAVDAETGEYESIVETDQPISRPTIVNGVLYAAVGGAVGAFDITDGTERWRTDDLLVFPSSIRRAGDVILALDQEQRYTIPEWEPLPQLFAIDAESGTLLWEGPGGDGHGTEPRLPIVTDGTVLYPNSTKIRDLRGGETVAEVPTSLNYPVLEDGILYGSDDGGFVSYGWSTMERRWEYRPEDRNVGGGWMAVVGDVVVGDDFRGPGFVGLDRETGEPRWETAIWDEHMPSLFRVIAGGTVYVVHNGGAAAALDPHTGDVEWRLRVDDWAPRDGCALADDLLLTVGINGTLYAIR